MFSLFWKKKERKKSGRKRAIYAMLRENKGFLNGPCAQLVV